MRCVTLVFMLALVAASANSMSDVVGKWTKRDRSTPEVRPILIAATGPNTITGTYGDTGVNTFNVTMVGDFMSGTGYYANWSDDGKIWCQAPFGLIVSPDTNVIYVSYGAVQNTPCGSWEGDSAAYYRAD